LKLSSIINFLCFSFSRCSALALTSSAAFAFFLLLGFLFDGYWGLCQLDETCTVLAFFLVLIGLSMIYQEIKNLKEHKNVVDKLTN